MSGIPAQADAWQPKDSGAILHKFVFCSIDWP